MTECRLIKSEQKEFINKKTLTLEFDLDDKSSAERLIRNLREDDWNCLTHLANILEKEFLQND